MSKVFIKCPKCGKAFQHTGFGEMVARDPVTRKRVQPVRRYPGLSVPSTGGLMRISTDTILRWSTSRSEARGVVVNRRS